MSFIISNDLQFDVEEARDAAFVHISEMLQSSSDLESLSSKKQKAILNHTETLGTLKKNVSDIVGNIRKGLSDMDSIMARINEFQQKLNEVKSGCKDPTAGMKDHYQQAKDLARVLERLYTVDILQKKFIEAEEKMQDVAAFMENNPNSISINCYKTICDLLDFERELKSKAKQSNNLSFLEGKFQPINEAQMKMFSTAKSIITSAFNKSQEIEITTDLLSRAIWISITHMLRDDPNMDVLTIISDFLTNSINNEFPEVNDDTSKNIDAFLKKLQNVLDGLTERLDVIIPALPTGINIMDIIYRLANGEVLAKLDEVLSRNKSSFLLSHIILWMRDYMSSMSHMLGVDPSPEFRSKLNDYEIELTVQIPEDMQGFLQKILDMEQDPNSLETSREGILTTPCPYDFQKRLVESVQIAKQTDIPDLIDKINRNLMQNFSYMTSKIPNLVSDTWYREYAVAAINNSLNAVKVINGLPDLLPGIVSQDDVSRLKAEWSQAQKLGISRLIYLIISEKWEGEKWDLRIDFNDRFNSIMDIINTIKKQMLPPLFRKFLNQFCHQIFAHYMLSYKMPYPPEKKPSDDEMISNVISDTDLFNDWLGQITSGSTPWLGPLQKAVISFQRFISEDSTYIISNVGPIISVFNDFTVDLIVKINKNKPKTSKIESTSQIETVFKDNTKNGNQNTYIKSILDKYGDDGGIIDKLGFKRNMSKSNFLLN